MEENKTVNIAEKVKAGAIAFIGAGFFTQGTLYFKEQSSYHIPRILYPIYMFLGNKGLAVAMIVLGLGLVYYGFRKWRKTGGNVIAIGAISAVSIVIFFSILLLTGNKKRSAEKLIKASEDNRTKAIEDMKAMERPNFGEPVYDKHFDNFETLLAKYKDALNKKDPKAVELIQKEFDTWNEQSSVLIQKLSTVEQKQQMALYGGKLAMQWQAANP